MPTTPTTSAPASSANANKGARRQFWPNRKIQARDIQGVRAGGTALINFPKGPRYKTIILEFQDAGRGDTNAPGTAFAGTLQVIAGSNIVRKVTAANLDLLNQSNGSRYAAINKAGAANGGGVTRLPIFFEEPWRKRVDFQNGIACETGWMQSNDVMQVQVPIAANVTTPILTAYAVVDDFSSGAPNRIMKYYSIDANSNSDLVTITNPFTGLPATDLVSQVSLFDPSDSVAGSKTVTQARLISANQIIVDDITRDQSDALHIFSDMESAPLAGIYNITFDHDDLFESLRSVQSMASSELDIALAAASNGTMTRVIQALGTP